MTSATPEGVVTSLQLEKFLDRFRDFENQHRNGRIEEARAAFAQVKSGAGLVLADVQTRARQLAPGFNIFSVLGFGHSEVRLHSALLAELLRVDGTHGQGRLFQAAFLKLVARALAKQGKHNEFDVLADNIEWEVVPGYTLPSGRRLDILLRNWRVRSLLVIENKIWAADQTNQLEDYLAWMERHDRYNNPYAKALVYLTPEGQEATSTRRHDAYVRLSYKWDIPEWLNTLLDKEMVGAPRVRETLSQYLALLPLLY